MTESVAAARDRRIKREHTPETHARALVPRVDLWAVIDAARTFHRRTTQGRQDSEHFYAAKEELERALQGLPESVWAKTSKP